MQKEVKKIYISRKNTAGAGRREKKRKEKDAHIQRKPSLQRKRIRKEESMWYKKEMSSDNWVNAGKQYLNFSTGFLSKLAWKVWKEWIGGVD